MSFSPEFGLGIRQKAKFLMECQSRAGVHFDYELGLKTFDDCLADMAKLEAKLKPYLPEVPTAKGKMCILPKRRFKNSKDGMVKSSDVEKFEAKHNLNYSMNELKELPHPHCINPTSEFDLWSNAHQLELKKILMDKYGWRPMFWNFKKDQKGKPIYDEKTKERTKVSPKFQDQGKLCPFLESLGEQVDFVKDVVAWTRLKHRRGVMRKKDGTGGWLGNERVLAEGRISARSSGITNTLRQKHTGVCNVPKPDVLYGDKLRGMIAVPPNKKAVGYDASSLEDMIKAHYAYKYDGGEYGRKVSDPDYDAHTEMQLAAGLEKRSDAKPVNYGLQYNQQVKGLAEATGWSLDKSKDVWETYWELNHGWKNCQDNLIKHWEQMNRCGIYCPISGLFLHSRSANAIGSLLIQHTGAFIMDYAGVIMDRWLGGIKCDRDTPYYLYKGHECTRVIYYHDEYMWESDPEIAEDILELGKESIREAGRRLKLNVPLDADGSIGMNWSDVH